MPVCVVDTVLLSVLSSFTRNSPNNLDIFYRVIYNNIYGANCNICVSFRSFHK